MDCKEIISDKIFKTVAQAAENLGLETYVIGGFVRDNLLLRKEPKDLDFVAVGSGIELAKETAKLLGNKRVNVFQNFGTAQIKLKDLELEFVGARKESYQRNSRKPIVEDGTLQDDQNRRDFTINALAISLNRENFGELLDPFNGLQDLENQIIKTPLQPEITFSDDPLRMMRAIRFASQLGFSIENQSWEAIQKTKERIEIISKERVTEELNKIMLSPKPSVGLELFYESGLMRHFLPEIIALKGVEEIAGQGHKENFYHTLQVVDNLSETSDNLWLRYAALFHDIGKPVTKKFVKGTGWTFHHHEFVGAKMVYKIFKRMKMPLGQPLKFVQKMVRLSSRPQAVDDDQATDSAARRLLFEAGDDIHELMLLAEADITTKNQKKKERFLQNFQRTREKLKEVEEADRVRNFQPPVDGQEIMELFDLKPSREIGILKEAVKEAILEGKIKNEYDEARAFVIEKAKELGIEPKN